MLMRNWQKSRPTKISGLLLLLLVTSCSYFKGKGNERSQGHHQLYSEPESPKLTELPKSQRRLIIVGTNDWEGNLEPQTEIAQDKNHPQKIMMSVGGVEVFARYLHILRTYYPDQVVTVDAGNSLGGTLDSRVTGAEAVLGAFEQLNYDAITFSAQDLAAGPSLKKGTTSAMKWMPSLLKNSKTPVLIDNLVDLHTAKPVAWARNTQQIIKTVNGVKVGFIGLLSDEVPRKLDPGTMNGLYLEPAMQSLLKQSRTLKLKGAEVIVLLIHGGIQCGTERATKNALPLSKVNFDASDSAACSQEGDLANLIQRFPQGMVSVIVTGGAGNKVANIINGIPVVQAFAQGRSFSRVDLVFDLVNKELLPEKTLIHQPVRLCHRFFKETEDCYTEDKSVDHRQLIPAKYLGEEIFPDKKVGQWMRSWRQDAAWEKSKIVTAQIDDHGLAKSLRESLATDVALVEAHKLKLKTNELISLRDLWKLKGARQKIQLVLLSGHDLIALREYIDGIEKDFTWSKIRKWGELSKQTNVMVAIPENIWEEAVEQWAKGRSLTVTAYLAPKLVADTLVSFEDNVTTIKSSIYRSPPRQDIQP